LRDADVVLFVGLTFALALAACVGGLRCVVSHHNEYVLPGARWAALKGHAKRWLARGSVNVAVSDFIASRLGARCTVIPNGYDERTFRRGALRPPPGSFVFCGRLVTDKGGDRLLRAFAVVLTRAPLSTLTLVGDGPEGPALQALARDLGIGDAVRFLGSLERAEVAGILRASACMIVPSIFDEPFGIVVLEGLACGCRMIVTDRGGLPEAAGGFARIVPPDPDRLAVAMCAALAADPAETGERALALQRFLARHRRDRVARRYARVLALVARRPLAWHVGLAGARLS
jgi:glycogen synthase